MSFTVEGDYIYYDRIKIARLLPALNISERRKAEEALTEFEEHLSDSAAREVANVERERITEKLNKLADISGGLLSWTEIEEAIESTED